MSIYLNHGNLDAAKLDLIALTSMSPFADSEIENEGSSETKSHGCNKKVSLSVIATLLLLLVAGGSAGEAALRGSSVPPPGEKSNSLPQGAAPASIQHVRGARAHLPPPASRELLLQLEHNEELAEPIKKLS